MEPNSTVRIVTDLMLRENTEEKLFNDEMNFKTITVEKNIRQPFNIELNDVYVDIQFEAVIFWAGGGVWDPGFSGGLVFLLCGAEHDQD